MNLQTLSRLPNDIAAPPLGAPTNRPQPKPADPGRWVPAATPGYLLHTGTRTMSREQDVPASERPTKPAPGMCLESGEFVPAEEAIKQPRDDGPCGVVPSVGEVYDAANAADRRAGGLEVDSVLARFSRSGLALCMDITADRRADVIAALNKLGR